jgi:hypothetical protein
VCRANILCLRQELLNAAPAYTYVPQIPDCQLINTMLISSLFGCKNTNFRHTLKKYTQAREGTKGKTDGRMAGKSDSLVLITAGFNISAVSGIMQYYPGQLFFHFVLVNIHT